MNASNRMGLMLGGAALAQIVQQLDKHHWWGAFVGLCLVGVIMWLTEPDHVSPILSLDGEWHQCVQPDPHPFHGWVNEYEKYYRCPGVVALHRDRPNDYDWHGIDG